MKLNRKTQPVVYRQVAINSTLLEDEKRQARLVWDIGVGIFGLAFVVFLFGILG
jgi:hypothetical protein